MDRNELIMLNTYKLEALKQKLKPITDWDDVKRNTLIFNEADNNIYNINKFITVDKEDKVVTYENREGKGYNYSSSDWYYYDECIVDEVNEYWTPKLWEVCDHREDYQCDRWLFIACNEEHLLSCWNKEQRDNLSYDEFTEKYDLSCISEVGDFNIKVE